MWYRMGRLSGCTRWVGGSGPRVVTTGRRSTRGTSCREGNCNTRLETDNRRFYQSRPGCNKPSSCPTFHQTDISPHYRCASAGLSENMGHLRPMRNFFKWKHPTELDLAWASQEPAEAV